MVDRGSVVPLAMFNVALNRDRFNVNMIADGTWLGKHGANPSLGGLPGAPAQYWSTMAQCGVVPDSVWCGTVWCQSRGGTVWCGASLGG